MKVYKYFFFFALLVSLSKECELPCLNCNGYICENCIEGFFLNSHSKCQSCDPPCFKCESSTICTECRKGYYLNSTSCELQPNPPEGLTVFIAQMIILGFLLSIVIGCFIENVHRIVLIRKYNSDLGFYNSKEIAGFDTKSRKTDDIESNEENNLKSEHSSEKLEVGTENISIRDKKKDANSLSLVLEEEPCCERLKETEENNLEMYNKVDKQETIASALKK